MARIFLDTNILLRHITADQPDFAKRATAFLGRIERGEIEVQTTDTVVFEAVFTLQRLYKFRPAAIRDAVLPLLELPGIVLPGKRRLSDVFDLYVETNISFADAYHAVLMRELGMTEIASFDTDFDHIPGLTRIAI